MSSIFDISYEMNGPLPFYHPNHLIHYIMWGKMDLVNNVLLSLSSFFKQFVDEEDKIINEFPPVSVAKMLKLQNVNEHQTFISCTNRKKKKNREISETIKESTMDYLTVMTMTIQSNFAA